MIDAFIVHNNPKVETLFKTLKFKVPIYLHFIDAGSKKGKKEAYTIKSEWGARLDPFILVLEEDKFVKAFYSEADKNVIKSFIKYINHDAKL